MPRAQFPLAVENSILPMFYYSEATVFQHYGWIHAKRDNGGTRLTPIRARAVKLFACSRHAFVVWLTRSAR
jgi:hypothetical protein